MNQASKIQTIHSYEPHHFVVFTSFVILGGGFSIGFGPVVNFNTYASIKPRYKFLGDKIMRLEKDIKQRPITIDWMLNMSLAGVPFYVKYSNDNVLKDGGIRFRSLSFGLYL